MTNEQERIKMLRKNKGYTQKDMANLLCISQQAYQQLETGRTEDMRISTLKKLCALFEVSADWLLGIGESNVIEFPSTFTIGLDAGNFYTATQMEHTEEGEKAK